jgi:hypothetical protein
MRKEPKDPGTWFHSGSAAVVGWMIANAAGCTSSSSYCIRSSTSCRSRRQVQDPAIDDGREDDIPKVSIRER